MGKTLEDLGRELVANPRPRRMLKPFFGLNEDPFYPDSFSSKVYGTFTEDSAGAIARNG